MEWNVFFSTSRLPDNIRYFFKDRADFLYRNLLESRYEGELVELPYTTTCDRQKGRHTLSKNPLWYSNFYWANTPHTRGKKGPRRKASYDIFKRSRFEKSLNLVAKSKDRDFLKYDGLAREIVMKTLLDGVEVREEDFSSLLEQVSFEMTIEPVNEVRSFFGEENVATYRDELVGFQKKYGREKGEVMFFSQYDRSFGSLDDIPF